MAKSRHAVMYTPDWLPQLSPANQTAPALTNPGSIDALNERIIFGGSIRWEDGGTHDVDAIRFRTITSSLVGTLKVAVREFDTVNGPPGRDDGTDIQSVNITNPAGTTNHTATLGSDWTGVATGRRCCVVFECTAFTSGLCQIATLPSIASFSTALPMVTSFLGGAYAAVQAVPCVTFVAATGEVGVFESACPHNAAAVTTAVINTGTTPDEVALAYTPTEPHWGGAFRVNVLPAASADFDIVLYEGTTSKASASIDVNTIKTSADENEFSIAFPDVAFTVGNTYYLAIKPTTANNVTVYLKDITSGDLDAFAKGFGYATRTDGGAWSAVDDTLIPFRFAIGMVASDDGAGSGGGGGPLIGGRLVR